MVKKVEKVEVQTPVLFDYAVNVDPAGSHSIVSYTGELSGNRWDSVTLQFGDCSRMATWEIYGTMAGLRKVRRAKAVLEKLEQELTEYVLNHPAKEDEDNDL